AELESEKSANKNAKGVPFTLEEFVDKALPQVVNHLNPTQRTIIENEFKRIGRDLTECYAREAKKDIDLEAEAEAAFPEPINELPVSNQEDLGFKKELFEKRKVEPKIIATENDKGNLTTPTLRQDDLPF
uniref:Phage portal protein n=1 Tax=Syphacia muris TaxID=451379 RepID=A0A0N5ACT8_9BILA